MLNIRSLLGSILLLHTCAFNAAPYETASHDSADNRTWNDLNKTVKSFNRSNMVMSEFSNLLNTNWSFFDIDLNRNEENSTTFPTLNVSNGIAEILNENLTNTEPLNTIVHNSTIKLPIVMNSSMELNDLNTSMLNPIVEILDPILDNQTSNFDSDLNSIVIDGTIQFYQMANDFVRPIENVTLDDEQTADVNANVTGEFFPISSGLIMNKSNRFELHSFIKLVSIESSNDSYLTSDFYALEASIKHSIIKYIDPKIGQFSVKLNFDSNIDQMSRTQEELPLNISVCIRSPIEISEIELRDALVEYAANTKRCIMQNQTEIRCSLFRAKDSNSLLRISDYWIDLGETIPSQEKLSGNEYEIFTYKPVWIVGLAIIGGIIAIFFLGCVVAICYTRRPYKRCGKIYEIDSATRKNNQPFIPGVHPATKASAITKTKEMYYQ